MDIGHGHLRNVDIYDFTTSTHLASVYRPYRTDVVLDDDDFSVSVRIDFAMDDSLGKTYPLAAAGAAWIDTDIF